MMDGHDAADVAARNAAARKGGDRAVIIAGGQITDYEFVKAQINPADTIICADSGYNHAEKMGLTPHAVVGDFDSIRGTPAEADSMRNRLDGAAPENAGQAFSGGFAATGESDFELIRYGIECIRFPAKKDFTDMEIAVDFARRRGFTDFLLLGATGTRADHSLTNIFMLQSFAERGETAEIVNENNKIRLINSRIVLHEPPGTIVSLVPLSHCTGICTQNMEYPLNNESIAPGKGRGVSNIITDIPAAVSLSEGLLLVIVAKD